MIVRDEAHRLRTCLDSVVGLFSDIVIVDTGSRDQSRRVAQDYGRVFEFSWIDDFSAARNFAKKQARSAWIMWLDADESLEPSQRDALQPLFTGLNEPNRAYLMRQCSAPAADGTAWTIDHVRLFPNSPDVWWEGRVHEQLLPYLRRARCELVQTPISIHHAGYAQAAELAAKRSRNLALHERQFAEFSADPYVTAGLASALLEAGDFRRGIGLLEGAMREHDRDDAFFTHNAAVLARAYRHVGRVDDAFAVCRALSANRDPELLFELAEVHVARGDLLAAEGALRHLLSLKLDHRIVCIDRALVGAKARHRLALVLWSQGQPTAATQIWQALTVEEPQCLMGWKGLAAVALAHGNWSLVAEIAARLEELADGTVEALILRSQQAVQLQDFAQAEELLRRALDISPSELSAKLLLSQCLLLQPERWPDAEWELLEVLKAAPHSREARRNLDVLRRRRGISRDGET